MQGDDFLLIDMETLSRGHPIFEFAGMYAAYIAFSSVNKNNTMEFLGIPREVGEKLFDLTFRGYYSDKTEEELEDIRKKIAFIAFIKMLYTRSVYCNHNDPLIMQDIRYAVNYLEDMLNELDDLYY